MRKLLALGRLVPVNGMTTHHEVVGIDPNKSSPDTDPNAASPPTCNGLEVMRWNLLFADGVGSPSLTLPLSEAQRRLAALPAIA
jgi:hypothetical protein